MHVKMCKCLLTISAIYCKFVKQLVCLQETWSAVEESKSLSEAAKLQAKRPHSES